ACGQREITALRLANRQLPSAWKHLGRRLAMAGQLRNLEQALADLRLVHGKAGDVIHLIEAGWRRFSSSPARNSRRTRTDRAGGASPLPIAFLAAGASSPSRCCSSSGT